MRITGEVQKQINSRSELDSSPVRSSGPINKKRVDIPKFEGVVGTEKALCSQTERNHKQTVWVQLHEKFQEAYYFSSAQKECNV